MASLIANYDSDDSDSQPDSAANKRTKPSIVVDIAPEVSTEDLSVHRFLPGVKTTEITHNVPYQDLAKPLVGPSNPFQQQATNKNILTGFVEEHAMSDFAFTTMERTYMNYGYTINPNGQNELIGNAAKIAEYGGATINDYIPNKNEVKRKRKPKGDPAVIGGYSGPWAGYVDEADDRGVSGPTEEEKAALEAALAATNPAIPVKSVEVVADPGKEKTVFHGKSEYDYLGRTYMHAPTDLEGINLYGESGANECFIPKRCVHTWTGHTKGVNQIRFLPKTAHLLLSASMDTKVKLWDVYNDRKCLRTFMGHSKGVKAVDFSNDGTRFLSCSYDKWIKLWDTETGQCIKTFSTKRVPNCVTFNPAQQNIFLTGCADKKVYQFDINSGRVVQEYDQHLGAVNTVTFVDESRRFVTTSDDKTLRAWEYNIPVVIKYIAEPDMHSMPAVTLHPSKKWLACQSLDNQIFIYSASDRFKLQRKKIFKGHLIAGYACKPGFSPDGRFIMSGDSEGFCWFWDWKTTKVYKKLKAHENVVMDCQWHPHEASKVATCSWDSTIKYWD
ncbi:hypothetical protein HK100_002567 [Physocladia obscura]|uniref:Pre-mRNA-processing factor 17 n=1 Tax=Physocladia obscura TaxID=109957 RepID=A0AAD5TBK7_9FUNG|nr:hypothetical protein HK100_002567 [Physocladia obscura]